MLLFIITCSCEDCDIFQDKYLIDNISVVVGVKFQSHFKKQQQNMLKNELFHFNFKKTIRKLM